MRWNCPHCGTALDVNDDKLGSGWSFSRCYRCSGHALIRRAEVNVIKVNGAPTGEQVLLPDSPPAKSNESLLREQFHKTARNILNQPRPTPATGSAIRPPAGPPAALPVAAAATDPRSNPPSYSNPPIDVPDPLPERPLKRSMAQKVVPVGIAVAGTLAVSSAIYLYIEGQTLWQKARASAVMGSNETVTQAATRATATAAAVAAAANPALATSSSLSATAEASMPPAPASTAPTTALQLENSQQPAAPQAELDTEAESDNEAEAQQVTTESARAASSGSLLIRVLRPRTEIHSGPSSTYPTIALANPTARFLVSKWNKRWFKVEAYSATNNRALAEIVPGHKTGWVRNDLVEATNAD